jgi:hypothetical protein
LERWEQTKEQTEDDLRQRVSFLLASAKVREWEDQLTESKGDAELLARRDRILSWLDEAKRLAAEDNLKFQRDARNIARDLLDLYGNDPNPEIKALAAQAEALLK